MDAGVSAGRGGREGGIPPFPRKYCSVRPGVAGGRRDLQGPCSLSSLNSRISYWLPSCYYYCVVCVIVRTIIHQQGPPRRVPVPMIDLT